MYKQFIVIGGALCVIATMSLLRLHLIEDQYAAAALGTFDSETSINNDESEVTVETTADTPALFPIAPNNKPDVSAETTEQAPEIINTTVTDEIESTVRIITVPTITNSSELNDLVRSATVNISCIAPGSRGPASGSGVIIDPRGVILTSAHVAQYLLLEKSGQISIDCVIRTGSPASAQYRAEVLYISTEWVRDHASEVREEGALGTGENDYALLRITESTTNKKLPSSYPFITPNTREEAQVTGQSVIISSYPAGFLGGISTLYELNLVSTITTIKELFTFSEALTADVIALGGVISAQSGSSGGAVADGAGRLLAIIATSSQADQTANRDLRAVTLFHINQSIIRETGASLNQYLEGNLSEIQGLFDTAIVPDLEKQFLDELLAT